MTLSSLLLLPNSFLLRPRFSCFLNLALLTTSFFILTPRALQAQVASEIDWVDWENLTAEQQSQVPDGCCGRYIEPPSPQSDLDTGSTRIRADRQGAQGSQIFTMEGAIEIQQDDKLLQADKGSYDRNSARISLEGNIKIRQPGLLMVGTDGQFNEATANTQLSNASYVMHEESARGSADVIIYTDEDGVVTIDNGTYTRCEPGDNSWTISGKSIDLYQDKGRGVARDVTLRINDRPVLYLPRIGFPINDERATGFLAPIFGNTRDGGFDLATPYYLNLAPHYDATVTPRLMTNRGVMLGLEGRYRGRRSQNVLNMNYLPDDDLYDPLEAQNPASDSPPTADRWLLDYNHASRFARGWDSAAIYTAVSDEDYFQDMGNNGLTNTTRSFLARAGQVRYRNEDWTLKIAALGVQIIDPAVPERNQPYDRLPKINLDGHFFHESGFEYGIETEYTHFDRNLDTTQLTQAQIDNGILVTGQRLSLEPEASMTFSTPGSFLTPTVKYKYASYALDDPANVFTDDPDRGVFMGSLDSGLFFERDISFNDSAMIQTLEPRLFYLYSEYEDQSDIPLFDSSNMTFSFNQLFREDRFSGKDRVGDSNQLTMALSSRLLNERGQEKLSASIGQIFYFEDRRVTLRNLPGSDEATNESAIAGELNVQLNDNWRIFSYLEWNPEESEFDVGNFQFRYQSDINHILNFSYRYRNAVNPITTNGIDRRIKQTDLSAVWPISENWGLIGRWNYDLANKRNLEAIAGFEYSNCCWSMRVIAREWIDNDALFFGNMEDNRGIFIQFELKGLGSVLGGNVSSILNNGISGYRTREYQ